MFFRAFSNILIVDVMVFEFKKMIIIIIIMIIRKVYANLIHRIPNI